jgi:TolA-binding protein
MPPAERQVFERRCEEDPEFAREVSFYVASRVQVRSILREEKKREFDVMYKELASRKHPASQLRRIIPYAIAAAASVLIFILFFAKWNASSGNLADHYIEENFTTLSVTMGDRDSLQTGIEAYNKKDYPLAAKIFSALTNHEILASEATRYLGITRLRQGDFDQAIIQFDRLASWPDLRVNPGKFYGALARLKRSTGNDKDEARKLLQEVVDEKLPGSSEASDWINKLK